MPAALLTVLEEITRAKEPIRSDVLRRWQTVIREALATAPVKAKAKEAA